MPQATEMPPLYSGCVVRLNPSRLVILHVSLWDEDTKAGLL